VFVAFLALLLVRDSRPARQGPRAGPHRAQWRLRNLLPCRWSTLCRSRHRLRVSFCSPGYDAAGTGIELLLERLRLTLPAQPAAKNQALHRPPPPPPVVPTFEGAPYVHQSLSVGEASNPAKFG